MEKENYKLFSAPRWNEPPSAKVIGTFKQTVEEEKETHEKFIKHLKKIGVIKD